MKNCGKDYGKRWSIAVDKVVAARKAGANKENICHNLANKYSVSENGLWYIWDTYMVDGTRSWHSA